MADKKNDAVRIHCAMSGGMEVLIVEPIGRGGVSFAYGDDASVIVDGEDLLRIRNIIDAQIAGGLAWKKERADHG